MKKTIVLAGGHPSPAFAVAEELMGRRGWKLYMAGRRFAFQEASRVHSFEYTTAQNMGIDFYHVDAPRFNAHLFGILSYMYRLVPAVIRMRSYLQKVKPHIAVGFGGYISVPVVLAAYSCGIPVVIHDQTFHPGRAHKLLGYIARNIYTSWVQTKKKYPRMLHSRIVLTGNPVRSLHSNKTQQKGEKKEDSAIKAILASKQKPLVYITGGSTGAHSINLVLAQALESLVASYRVIVQCGDSHYDDFTMLQDKKNKMTDQNKRHIVIKKYVDIITLSRIVQNADIIVSRSGINTIVELALSGVPSVLIPHPAVPGDEQSTNAAFLKKRGSAEILYQYNLSVPSLLSSISRILANKDTYRAKAKKIQASQEVLLHSNASRRIADLIEHIVSSDSRNLHAHRKSKK